MKQIPFTDVVNKLLASPNVVSQKPIYEGYDKNVQGKTAAERGHTVAGIIMPFREAPELKGSAKSTTGVAIGTGGNPFLGRIDAQAAAEKAIAEAALKVACVGGEFLGATDCLNFGNPEKPEQMGELVSGIEGVKVACTELEIPIVSGNVSLYNESGNTSIPPSALVSVFARVDDPFAVPVLAMEEGHSIFIIGKRTDDFGGSQLARSLELDTTSFQPLDYDIVRKNLKGLQYLAQTGGIYSANTIGSGGVFMAVLEGVLAGDVGAEIQAGNQDIMALCFNENLGAVITSDDPTEVIKVFGDQALEIGKVVASGFQIKQGEALVYGVDNLSDIEASWSDYLRKVL